MAKKERYSSDYKEQAVKRTFTGEATIKEVAELLGINYHTLKTWRKEYIKSMDKSTHNSSEVEENSSELLKELLKENKRLKEENEILKKYAAMLSREK